MKIYFKVWGINKIALLNDETNGDVYQELAMQNVVEMDVEDIKEYLIDIGELKETDELIEIDKNSRKRILNNRR